MQANQKSVNILGVEVGTQTSRELIDYISQSIDTHKRILLAYVNIYAINLAQHEQWFKSFLNNADMAFCDGYGIKLGARLLGYHIPERYTPPDWIPLLASVCASKGFRMYFLGAQPGVADLVAQQLKGQFSELQIAGVFHGYFDKTVDSAENEDLIRGINELNVDVLVVGMGIPTQEKWLAENWSKLNCHVIIPVGAAFDYLAGTIPRAPRWVTDHGFEWLGRLITEPGRMWKRYLVGIPVFYFNILRQRLGLFPLG